MKTAVLLGAEVAAFSPLLFASRESVIRDAVLNGLVHVADGMLATRAVINPPSQHLKVGASAALIVAIAH